MQSVLFQNAVIYYFSGTGNARFAAEEIGRNLKSEGLECEVLNIADKALEVKKPGRNTLLGFCYPTHGFNAPPFVLKFLSFFPKGKSKVFILNTRAGMKMYKLHTPGLGGIALWLPALILWLKGYRIFGFRPLDMPSNWIPLHPGIREIVILSIKAHCTQTLRGFSVKISNGKKVLNGLMWIPLDLMVAPIALGYYFYGRFGLSKTFFTNYRCNNCNLCIENCPVGAIKSVNNRPFWTYKCESCMQCMNICPHRAIETSHTYTFIVWWTAWVTLPVVLPDLIIKSGLMTEEFYYRHYDIFYNFILYIVGIAFIFGVYRIVHFLLGSKTFNKVMTFFSFTHFRFWRRYNFFRILKKKHEIPK
jgi:ferredoxin